MTKKYKENDKKELLTKYKISITLIATLICFSSYEAQSSISYSTQLIQLL